MVRSAALCETDFDAKDLGLAADEVASGLEKASPAWKPDKITA